jgi:hypothetical protein
LPEQGEACERHWGNSCGILRTVEKDNAETQRSAQKKRQQAAALQSAELKSGCYKEKSERDGQISD